ncbi:hypothetical protein [Legionella genomosp. 1]|uniref:hypothetical protein n=1 Tax=Legionella genomosp. 1 TaxID=1093625 RepID=UPI0010549502|nr:hypothetical protein [Legionella genomosp. 1]
MNRPVALLDIDKTLLFNANDLNENLLNALNRNGIKDIYLFSDMRFRVLETEERIELIKKLEAKGFTVHGIITPCDLVWNQMTKENAHRFDQLLVKARETGEKEYLYTDNEFDDFISKLREDNPFLDNLLKYQPDKNIPGAAFQAARKDFEELTAKDGSVPMPNGLLERSTFAKGFADRLANRMNYKHTKALMLDLFLKYKPDWVSDIFIADDLTAVIESIKEYREQQSPDLAIATLLVTNKLNNRDLYPDQSAEEYDNALAAIALLTRIAAQIDTLEQSSIFLRNPELKIKAFQNLRSELVNAFNGNTEAIVGDLIENWEHSPPIAGNQFKNLTASEIMAQHRNFFFSTDRKNTETSTQIFITDLKKDFGSTTFNKDADSSLSHCQGA